MHGGVLARLSVWSEVQTWIWPLMPLTLTVSCFSKSRLVLPFWYRPFVQVVPDKKAIKWVCVCVCVCVARIENCHLLHVDPDTGT